MYHNIGPVSAASTRYRTGSVILGYPSAACQPLLDHSAGIYRFMNSTTLYTGTLQDVWMVYVNHWKTGQWTIQNRNVHISVLNGALWDMGWVHCGNCEIGLLAHNIAATSYLSEVDLMCCPDAFAAPPTMQPRTDHCSGQPNHLLAFHCYLHPMCHWTRVPSGEEATSIWLIRVGHQQIKRISEPDRNNTILSVSQNQLTYICNKRYNFIHRNYCHNIPISIIQLQTKKSSCSGLKTDWVG